MLTLKSAKQLRRCLFLAWCVWFLSQPYNSTYASPLPKTSSFSDNGDIKREGSNLSTYEKQLEDEEVRQLQSLKPSGNTISVTKSGILSISEKNGKISGHQELKEDVSKNDDLLQRTQQRVDIKQNDNKPISRPEVSVLKETEFPQKGTREIFQQNVNDENAYQVSGGNKRKSIFHHNRRDEKSIDSNNNAKNTLVPYTPFEMAEYIYETGDEKTVTFAVENFIQNGLLDREEAINYLQDIKSALNVFQLQEEQDRKDKKEDSQNVYDKVFEYPRSRTEVKEALSDLKEIQKLLQNKYMKSFPSDDFTDERYASYHREREDDDNEVGNNYSTENEGKIHLTEKDYQTLIEKLQLFENLFSEASMEEVIYELAKVLFSQSFSMGGAEAQEALKQFTTFLETQVEEGHISRNMERKVLDILISALADVLNEHPELIITSRQKINEADKQLEERKTKLNHVSLERKNALSGENGKHLKTDLLKRTSMHFSVLADNSNGNNNAAGREHVN